MGLSQAIQKARLPRALLTDNGAAMIAEEVTEGLLRLGIVHEKTLPFSPYAKSLSENPCGTQGDDSELKMRGTPDSWRLSFPSGSAGGGRD